VNKANSVRFFMLMQQVHHLVQKTISASVFFICGTGSVNGQELAQSLAGEKCSIFRVALTYAEAIHSFDTLVLERQSYEKLKTAKSPSEGVFTNVILSRTIFDQSINRVLVSARAKSEWLEFDKLERKNQGRTVKVAESGFLFDYKKQQIFFKRRSKLLEYPWIEHLTNFDDPRTAGFGGTKFGSLNIVRPYFERMATGDTLMDSKETEDRLELRIRSVREEEAKVTHVRHFYFDKKTHLPVRCQSYVEFDAGGRTQPEEAYIEWREISDMYVPVRLRAKACRSYKGPYGEACDGILTTEFDIDWLMINQPLPEARFETSNLTDSQKFSDSIDPVKNNATSIIEVFEQEKEEANPREDK
jgi:hypothetical protein